MCCCNGRIHCTFVVYMCINIWNNNLLHSSQIGILCLYPLQTILPFHLLTLGSTFTNRDVLLEYQSHVQVWIQMQTNNTTLYDAVCVREQHPQINEAMVTVLVVILLLSLMSVVLERNSYLQYYFVLQETRLFLNHAQKIFSSLLQPSKMKL